MLQKKHWNEANWPAGRAKVACLRAALALVESAETLEASRLVSRDKSGLRMDTAMRMVRDGRAWRSHVEDAYLLLGEALGEGYVQAYRRAAAKGRGRGIAPAREWLLRRAREELRV